MVYDIKINNVCKAFSGTMANDQTSLRIAEGEMFGLIGPDGAGKTTLLRILCGLVDADSGDCFLAGKNIRTQSRSIRAFLGYMPQRFSLYPDLTVSENLHFFADLYNVAPGERQKRTLRLLQFSRLGPVSTRRAAHLSGGMKQKLALSCTLIHAPRILLLDEPTTGVDPVSRREFWEILYELKRDRVTIVMSTPYLEEATHCDRIAFIHKGRILSLTSPDRVQSLFRMNLIELRTTDNRTATRLLKDSRQFDSVQLFGDRLHLSDIDDAADMKNKCRNIINRTEIRILGMAVIAPSIEDVFIDLLK